ncbi:MAG: hypothetical protein HQK92_11200 [Nitrospirae bacterium]|nr:hypothetical protein [Nitrospirota bacterium]
MNKQVRYLLAIGMIIVGANNYLPLPYGFAETERIGKPDVVTAKKAKKENMKQLLKDAKSAFADSAQQAVIVKIIKELGAEE